MNILEKIIQSSKKTDTILTRIGLYIEQKNAISGHFNYWDSAIDTFVISTNERLFYKFWLWLSYIEYEQIISNPPQEVFELLNAWKCNFVKEEITEKLILWAKENLDL